MQFHEMLNDYLRRLNVTALELAAASELSPAVISRYRSAERTPAPDSEALTRLAKGIASLAGQKGDAALSQESVLRTLRKALGYEEYGQARLAANFDLLVNVLHLRSGEMARALSFDPSYLSRIRMGKRTPANPAAFARAVGNYTARRCRSATERADLAALLGQEPQALVDDASCSAALARWLLSGEAGQPDCTFSFLEKLDEFDLNDYIRAVRFDQMKVPTVPFQLPSFKMHYGLENFRQALLDFLKSTALSRSRDPVFMCSDMPMEELARDMDFSKKWMLGLAAILKKGLHLDMVHDLNRPYAEMMLGLESWIPLYMTGQISPWYLRGRHNGVYGHLLFCSGAAAVEGECISGDFAHGRFLFSQAKSDLPYYRRRADAILQTAQPLMDIYRDASEGAYSSFLFADARETGEYRAVLTALPPPYAVGRMPYTHFGEKQRAPLRGGEHTPRVREKPRARCVAPAKRRVRGGVSGTLAGGVRGRTAFARPVGIVLRRGASLRCGRLSGAFASDARVCGSHSRLHGPGSRTQRVSQPTDFYPQGKMGGRIQVQSARDSFCHPSSQTVRGA